MLLPKRDFRMNVPETQRHCRTYRGVREIAHGEPWNVLVYVVGDRRFAYFKTSEPERWRFSVRVTPDRFVELTDMPGVKPARFRGRYHWITIVNVESFPSGYLVALVEGSYRRALEAQPKRRQIEILGKPSSPAAQGAALRSRR